jgi:transposase-like protein
VRCGLRRPEFLMIDGGSGLENAIAAVCDGVPVQRCTIIIVRMIVGFVSTYQNVVAAVGSVTPEQKTVSV